jgi:hypothetical protein
MPLANNLGEVHVVPPLLEDIKFTRSRQELTVQLEIG